MLRKRYNNLIRDFTQKRGNGLPDKSILKRNICIFYLSNWRKNRLMTSPVKKIIAQTLSTIVNNLCKHLSLVCLMILSKRNWIFRLNQSKTVIHEAKRQTWWPIPPPIKAIRANLFFRVRKGSEIEQIVRILAQINPKVEVKKDRSRNLSMLIALLLVKLTWNRLKAWWNQWFGKAFQDLKPS